MIEKSKRQNWTRRIISTAEGTDQYARQTPTGHEVSERVDCITCHISPTALGETPKYHNLAGRCLEAFTPRIHYCSSIRTQLKVGHFIIQNDNKKKRFTIDVEISEHTKKHTVEHRTSSVFEVVIF